MKPITREALNDLGLYDRVELIAQYLANTGGHTMHDLDDSAALRVECLKREITLFFFDPRSLESLIESMAAEISMRF